MARGSNEVSPVGSAVPPRYIDALITDFERGVGSGFNHLGHWDDRAEGPVEADLHAAQRRMHDLLVGLAAITDGSRVLDVGCGFGGTLGAINRQFSNMTLAGLEIDHRQLNICRRLRPSSGNDLAWIRGDACAMPFPNSVFDHALSIEAMWHFPSRARFLREASRVLRQDATLVVVDILIVNDAAKTIGWSREEMLRTLLGGFAPWPEPGTTVEDIVAIAGVAGLECGAVIDATNETKPTYADHGDSTARPGAAAFSETAAVRLFVEMHQRNLLKVVYLQFRKTGRPIAVAVRTDHGR